jgi:hypothetical protein
MANVGDIILGLHINDSNFQSELKASGNKGAKSLEGTFSKTFSNIAKMAAAAFSVKAISGFVSECLELGSDLAEVQNVVDTAFPNMSAQADAFAKSAMESFGLSETVAKRYMGTFGAMASAFGYNEQQAYEMSETLTGLVGDVASFYNLDSDEAYTKLKSVFTGETESLKDLGVVMTQTSLDSYALANGFGKTTDKMTEQEKVALRMAFVTDQLSMASGDFVKTQDSWANQTRILSLRMDSLKASLGKGFIAIFTPIIKYINLVLSKLQVLADSFGNLMEFLTGKKQSNSNNNVSNVSDDLTTASDSADNLSSNLDNAGTSGEEAAKKINKAFAGVDTINKLSFSSDTSDSSNNNADTSAQTSSSAVKFSDNTDETTVFSKQVSGLVDELKKLKDLFKEGFEIGFGNSFTNIEKIKTAISNIGTSLKNIFTDEDVVNAAKTWVETTAKTLGEVTGSIASIGVTIATLLVGSVSKYLSDNEEKIKGYIIKWFDIDSKRSEIIGNFSTALADIVSVFSGDTAISIGSNLIGIIVNSASNSFLLLKQLGTDILDVITAPIIDNKDKIKTAIENTLSPINTVLGTIKDTLDKTWEKIWDVYDKNLSPLFESLKTGLSDIVSTLLDGYNTYVSPVLDKLSKKFKDVIQDKVQPMIDSFLDATGSICDLLKSLWDNILQPLFKWVAENIMPIIADIVEAIGESFLDAISDVSDFLKGLFDIIKTGADVLTDVIDGFGDFVEWIGKLPSNVSMTFSAVKDAAFDTIQGAWNSIKDSTVVKTLNAIKDKALDTVKGVWDAIQPSNVAKTLSAAKDKAFDTVKGIWDNVVPSNVKKTLEMAKDNAFNNMKDIWDAVQTGSVKKTLSVVKDKLFSGVQKVWDEIVPENVKKTLDAAKAKTFNNVKKVWDAVKSASVTKKLSAVKQKGFDNASKAWDSLKSKALSLSLKFATKVENMKKFINSIIDSINKNVVAKLYIKISDKIPFIGGHKIGPPANIPHLANGGYIGVNQPTLAMIGDNRHYGEIVAPENKMIDMINTALQMQKEQENVEGVDTIITLIRELIDLVKNMVLTVDVDVKKLSVLLENAKKERQMLGG